MTRTHLAFLLLTLTACAGGSRVDSNNNNNANQDGGQTDAGPAQLVSLAIAPGSVSVSLGAQEQLTATATWSDGAVTDVTTQADWTISNSAVAALTQSSDGLRWARGTGTGSASLSASYGGQSASALIDVTQAALVSLTLSPNGATVAAGTSVQFRAVGLYTNGARYTVTADAMWLSWNGDVLAAGASAGGFDAKTQGAASVSASLGGLSASANVTVTAATLGSIQVSPADATIAAGTSLDYTATGIFSDLSTQDLSSQVTWSSSQSAAAMSGSTATGSAVGSTNISASFGGRTGSTSLTVTDATLTGIEIVAGLPVLAAGTSEPVSANGFFSDGSVQDVTGQVSWSSLDPSIASVDAAVLAAHAAGTITVSGVLGTFSDSVSITVTPATLSSISIADPGLPLPRGTSRQLAAIGSFSDGSSQDLTGQVLWTLSDASIALISNDPGTAGSVRALSPGTVLVSAALLGATATASLTVSSATLSSIAISPSAVTVPVKFSRRLNATGTFSDGSTQPLANVLWSSSNGSIATAGAVSGLVTGVAAGVVTVTAAFGSISGSAIITVLNTRLSSIAVTPNPLALAKGTSALLTATGTFQSGFTMDVTDQVKWTSSNRNVAWAGNSQRGMVKASAAGTATVTASRTGKSGSATVNVY